MKNKLRQSTSWRMASALLLICIALAAGTARASDAFERDCRALAGTHHRLTGTPEYEAAAEHVRKRLEQIGVDKLIVQEFPAAQTRTKRCELIVAGSPEPLKLLPMRPNGIIPPVTPPEGITGPLVYAGAGSAQDLANKNLRGAIAVLDYNAGRGWMRALRLGAKAVIFVRNGPAWAWHPHYVSVNANLPRFYYPGERGDLPIGPDHGPAAIHSEVVWEPVVGRNILAFLNGTDAVFDQEKEEMLILAAPLDSFGEVPQLSPGARGGANCAALLKLAELFKKRRPRRHVLFVFLDAQARGHNGGSVLYRALEEQANVNVEDRRKWLDAERGFLDNIEAMLATDAPLDGAHERGGAVKQQLLTRLRNKAAERAYTVSKTIYALRQELRRITSGDGPGAANTARPEEIAQILKKKLLPEKDRWNAVRRALGRENTTDLPDDAREKLDIILSDVAKDARLRRAELGLEDRALNADTELKELVGDYRITVHVSLLLGDSTPNWGLIIGGDSGFHSQADNPGLYGKIQSAFVRAYRATEELGHAPGHFLLASADQTLSQTRMLLAAPFFIHSGEIAGRLAVYNLAIGTCQERLAREGTPDDTLANIDTARIEAQTDEIGMLLFSMAEQTIDWSEEKEAAVAPEAPRLEGAGGLPAVGDSEPNAGDSMSPVVADQKALSLRRTVEANTRYSLPEFNNGAAEGTMVMGALAGSAIRNIPMPGAIVQFWAKKHRSAAFDPRKPYAFDDFQVLRTNLNGTYAFGPVSTAPFWDMPTGGFAALFDERGAIVQASDMNSYVWFTYRCTVFRCRSGLVLLPPQPGASVRPNSAMAVYEARSNARLDANKSFELMADGIFHWYCDERVDAVKLFGLAHVVGLNIAGTTRPGTHGGGLELGHGFSMTSPWEPMTMARRSAADLWHLNELRLDKLRKKDITDSSLSELHGRAEDLLAAADAEADPVRSEALAASSFMASQPVYRQARAMLDDLVFAVLILLGLSVPFAFAVERVAVGSAMIYRQIIWATVFFVATFITLFVSHPAFAVANTPVIIFLGFAVVVMSTLVIFILMRKFEMELKVLQGATSGAHVAGVSKVGTFLAAMQMGISTMRRRPLRTTLTAVTIILLTYTILCFASFSTQRGIVKVFSEPNPPYAGVWVHAIDWQPLGPDLVDVLGGRWGQQADLCPRRWICPTLQDDPGMLVTLRDGSNPVTVRGLLGLNPAELKHRDDLAALFGDELEGKVLVTQAVARKLGVKPGDQVMLSGVPLTVGPLLDAARVATVTDMDGSGILPVDFTDVTSSQRDGSATIEAMETRGTWTDLPADSVAVVSTRTAELLGADLYGLMLYTGDSAAAVGIADDLARILTVPVAATRANGVYLHLLGTVLAASGAKDLLFPILLGGLVVFGTMLGSVTDREKEIYTFSAVGLAPRHVATLFFAESMIYSLIGGMGGYLVAQASVKILAVLASYGLIRPPDMNMSSTNTITTILIVMATVMISAIYPAIKASRSANPGLMRSWRPPRPEGDVWNLVFPFTVSEYDITGVVSFLEEHFDNYSDTGLGRFMARQTGLVRAEDGSLGLASHITLSPFDLGVSQRFALHSVPSEIPGIDEVQIMLERTSGQPKDWHRLNKVFLDDLRQQFLFWRSLPNKTMEIYRRRTLTKLGEDANERDKNESPGGHDDE